ncbi:MAG: sulfate permease [Actinobacteria bacterium]|nr:sulfate permease [Actinomycetota bacterium]
MPAIRHLRPPRPTMPGIGALGAWRWTVRGDTVAGLAVAAYLVPQCMAYARLAGVPPVTGLWAALGALVLYALLGTSSRLSVGPDSASALLVGSAVATIGADVGPQDRAQIAAALALAVGAIALLAWTTRLGFLADLLSRPVLVGYMTGVAVTMIVSQLPNLTGISSARRDMPAQAVDIVLRLGDLQPAPLAVGAAVVAALTLLQRIRRVPGPLVVVLGATAVSAMFDLEDHGVTTIGRVPSGLPPLTLPGIPTHLWPSVLAAAAGICVVVFTDNILTARAFATRRGDRIDANQELLALAGANAAAGIVGGFPVSSSGSRTAIADTAGARSQVTSLVAAVAVALVLLFGAKLLESFPRAALGGLVVYAAGRLIDLTEMRRIAAFRRSEAVVAAASFAGVLMFDLLAGIGIAVALSVVELFARIARAHDAVQGQVPGLAGLHDIDDYPDATTLPGLVVYRYDAPLCFANSEDFRRRVTKAVNEADAPVEWVVLNMEANVEIDLTATDMLEALRSELASRGIQLVLGRVKHDLAVYLDRAGFTSRVGADHMYPTLPTALEGFLGRHGSAPQG